MVSVILRPALAAGHLHFHRGFRHHFVADKDDSQTDGDLGNADQSHLPAVQEEDHQIKQSDEDIQEGFGEIACQKIVHIVVVPDTGYQITGVALVKKGDGQAEHMGQESGSGDGAHHAFQLLQQQAAVIGKANLKYNARSHENQNFCQPVPVAVAQHIVNKGLGQHRQNQAGEKQQ